MKIKPTPLQATFIEKNDGLEIRLPAKRNVFVSLFTSIWLCGWFFGWVSAASELLSKPSGPGQGFVVFWLGGWTLAGGAAVYGLLWGLIGFETVGIGGGELILKKCLGSWVRSREFDLKEVTNLRVSGQTYHPYYYNYQHSGFGRGTMAFDYGAETYYFGAGMEEAEAQKILAALNRSQGKL